MNHSPPHSDIIGERFGRLTVLALAGSVRVPRGKCKGRVLCRCDCGAELPVFRERLRAGHTSSCGCFHREALIAASTTHGATGTPEHSVWRSMKARCENPRNRRYADYGGRGIRICDRWQDFASFYADMGPRPRGTSIDRIDNNKGYEPGNCRWATRTQQSRNRRGLLTEEDVRQIRCLIALDMKRTWIAETFGVCRGTVLNIQSRKHWA